MATNYDRQAVAAEVPADSDRAWPRVERRRGELPHTGWVYIVDARGQLPARNVGTGHGRGVIAAGHDGVWVANGWSRTVARLDPLTFELTSLLKLRKIPVSITMGPDAVWVLCANGWLWRIWPAGPQAEGIARLGRGARAVAAAGRWIWVLRETGQLVRVEPVSSEVTLEAQADRGARNMIAADGALWVTCRRGRKLLRIDPESGRVDAEIRVPHRVIRLAADGDKVWAACGRRRSPRRGWLYAIDTKTASLGAPAEVAGEPRALAVGAGAVWVACAPRHRRQGVIERLDPSSGSIQPWADTDWPIFDLVSVADSLLATMSLRVSGPVDAGTGVFDLGGGGGGGDGGGGGGHHG